MADKYTKIFNWIWIPLVIPAIFLMGHALKYVETNWLPEIEIAWMKYTVYFVVIAVSMIVTFYGTGFIAMLITEMFDNRQNKKGN